MVKPGFTLPEDEIESGAGQRRWVNCTFYGETQDEVIKKRKDYFDLYPPQGYDTHTVGGIRKNNEAGYYFVNITRWSTCS